MFNFRIRSGALPLFLAIILLVLPLSSGLHGAERLTLTDRDFATWNYPQGLVEVHSDGVQVRSFGKSFNAVANRGEFEARTIGEHGVRELWTPSNQRDVGLLADQDHGTWWQPDPQDPPERWWVEIDLGRLVVAQKIRLIFPDTTDARPFAFFNVFTSPGLKLRASPDKVLFDRAGRTINNNTRQVVEVDLRTLDTGVATGQFLATGDSLDFRLVRFVRFEAAGPTRDAALAEIEVETIGFNLSTKVATELREEQGLETWGGRAWTSDRASGAEALIDGDLAGRSWNQEAAAAPDWRSWGAWWVMDMGSVFRIDRIVWLPMVQNYSPMTYGFDLGKQCSWTEVDLLTSDGTPSNRADPEVEGPYLYDLLSSLDNRSGPRTSIFDLEFPSRETRYVMWRRMSKEQICWALQFFVYHSEGYPAQVGLESEDMDLGGGFSIRRVEWDAELPADTRIEVETQTGNGFITVKRYFLKNGQEVTKEKYESTKSRNQGDIVDDVVRDPTWSDWSDPHRFSGQDFLSPTPRRWLRIRVKLISGDAEVAPELRSLSFLMNTPVINSGLQGEILPREAALDSLQEFRYVIRPIELDSRDVGFDRVLITVPPTDSDAALTTVRVGGREVEAQGQLSGDSLLVQLPPPAVKSDSVEVFFQTRVFQSPTVFDAFVMNSTQEENIQGVVPADYGVDQVFVPDAVEATSLFQNLAYSQVFSPNGDGANDLFQLSFNVVKTTSREPQVRIYSLAGRRMADLQSATPVTGRAQYTWEGRDAAGQAVPPGLYILRMRINADAGEETVQKLVHVVY